MDLDPTCRDTTAVLTDMFIYKHGAFGVSTSKVKLVNGRRNC